VVVEYARNGLVRHSGEPGDVHHGRAVSTAGGRVLGAGRLPVLALGRLTGIHATTPIRAARDSVSVNIDVTIGTVMDAVKT
jgi:hypothetical protein